MKKFALLAAVMLLGMTAPSFAQTSTEKAMDIQSDAGAVVKDNNATAHDNANIAANRAAKAKAKANGDTMGQAAASVKIGANKSARSEKATETDVDQHVLTHDEQK